ncbi:MAG TPA: hypothetical protein VGX37_06590 [Allosphingosinicella sp.]|nr:hypothetical protein [Allosphingosinicella sp.]
MKSRDSAERFRRRRRSSEPAPEAEDPPARVRGFASLPTIAAALVGALVLGFFVVRYSVVNALLGNPMGSAVAASLAPDHPAVALEAASTELQLTGSVRPATERAALEAFRRSPLSEVPILIAARKALARSDEAAAARLIDVARRRNPRSRYAVLLRLDQQARLGDAEGAIETMAILTGALPNAGPMLTAQLAQMAENPRTRDAVQRVIAGNRQLRTDVLEQLARRGADPALVLALAGPLERPAPNASAPQWQRQLIEGMVERGQVAAAHEVWARLSGIAPAALAGGIYDRDFAGSPGPPPFNWQMETSSEGFAERSNGALEVQYYGRGDARLAGQLLVLRPGRYRISFTAEGEAQGENGGRLVWTVSCYPGGPVGLEIPITGVVSNARTFTDEFTVPPRRCPGQWLRLVGTAAEFPKDQRVTIRQLRIEGPGLR